MAHKKGLGSSRNGRDSNPKMLGVKVFAGQRVSGGEIIVRQRGTRFWPGEGTGLGRDHTIFATQAGSVSSSRRGAVGPFRFFRTRLPLQKYETVSVDRFFGCVGELLPYLLAFMPMTRDSSLAE